MNKRRGIMVAAALLVALALVAGALAQGVPAIERRIVAGAGGESTGAGELAVNSTLGEPIIGPAGGGSVSLGAGYWHGGAAEYKVYLPLVLRSY